MSKQLAASFRYAWKGLTIAWREGNNFRIEIACALLAIALGLFVGLSSFEFALVLLTIGVVLAAEIFNTALEELCDKFQPTHDPHIAKIKDLSAAAVLVTALCAALLACFIFIPYL
ncbi:MAG: diacylglycerol kinase family protein [Minisyncoccia bacterium]